MTTKEACPVLTLGSLWHFFNIYFTVFGLLMIFGGLFLMIFGGKHYKVTMFLAGQLAVASFIMILMFSQVYPNNSPMWVVWLTLLVAIGIGSGIGFAA